MVKCSECFWLVPTIHKCKRSGWAVDPDEEHFCAGFNTFQDIEKQKEKNWEVISGEGHN